MRRMFPILAVAVFALVLAVPLGVSGQGDPPVVVTIVCNPDGTSSASVDLDPYPRTLSQTSRWRLNINRPNVNTLAIEPKPERRWPFTESSYGAATGLLEIPPDQFTGETGEFWYQVAYTCDGQTRQVLDPRMGITGGGGG
jgi:hypothetical protein